MHLLRPSCGDKKPNIRRLKSKRNWRQHVLGGSDATSHFHILHKPNCGLSRPMRHLRTLRPHPHAINVLLLPLLLVACGISEPAPVPGKMSDQAREFSDKDKEAALALSIGNVQALSAETSAYDRALSCSIALQSVYSQLSESGQLDTVTVNSIDQVRTAYDNRVQQLGSAENKSTADITADRVRRADEIPEPKERGQIAIGCLRAML